MEKILKAYFQALYYFLYNFEIYLNLSSFDKLLAKK